MKKKNGQLAITLVSLFLGIILAIQFKTVNKTVGEGVLPTQRAQQLAIELKKAQEERDAALKALDEAENKIKRYEKGEIDNNAYAENLYKDLEKYRILAGYVDLKAWDCIRNPRTTCRCSIWYRVQHCGRFRFNTSNY